MFWLIYVTIDIQNVLLCMAWMQAWRRLRHCSMLSSTTLCSALQFSHIS